MSAIGGMRKAIRNALTEICSHLPLGLRAGLFSHFLRPTLWVFFHLEPDEISLTRVGPPGHRFRMFLPWQGNPGLLCVLGAYEPEAVEALRQAVKAGSCCIDVGANIGYYTILMARLTGAAGHVIAFEPFPRNLRTLRENVDMNRIPNIQLEPLALGETNGLLSLHFAADEDSSATPSSKGYAVQGRTEKIEVPMVSLDEYLSRGAPVPRLIKIDVEGAELDVLRGAQRTLAEAGPDILLEVHGWNSAESDEVLRLLTAQGYEHQLLAVRGKEGILFCSPHKKDGSVETDGLLHERSKS